LLEAPSGYFADIIGRKTALVRSSIHGFGYLLLNFADDLSGLIVFEITVGITMNLLYSTDLALLYDIQKVLQDNQQIVYS
jgi:MFS family permease